MVYIGKLLNKNYNKPVKVNLDLTRHNMETTKEITHFIPLSEFVELTNDIETIRKYAKLCKTKITKDIFVGNTSLFANGILKDNTISNNEFELTFIIKKENYILCKSKRDELKIDLLMYKTIEELILLGYNLIFNKPLSQILEEI